MNRRERSEYRLESGKAAHAPAYGWMAFLIVVAVITTDLLQIPKILSFDNVAFGDGGFNISVQALIDRGYRAGIDFGYPYGALSLLYGKLWFCALGLRPQAFFSAIISTDVIFALGLARFVLLVRARAAGIALALIGAVLSATGGITLAHGLERACICWALVAQISSQRSRALALAAAAALVKPSMGYIYGAWLIALIALDLRRESQFATKRLAYELGPAALTSGFLVFVLSLIYGPQVMLHLLLPLAGAEAYRANGFGFFGREGSAFWYFPGVHVAYYFGTPVAFWFAASACLWGGAAKILARFREVPAELTKIDETIITCAMMHLAFVLLLFGSNASWTNYIYVLVMGTVIISKWRGPIGKAGLGLVLLGLAGQKGMLADDLMRWSHTAPSEVTAGLWTTAKERDEWQRVLELTSNVRAIVLSGDGAAQVLFPQMAQPVGASLIHGQTPADELRRTLDAIRRAGVVIIPEVPSSNHLLGSWTEISEALSGWPLTYRGTFFAIYSRGAKDQPKVTILGGGERAEKNGYRKAHESLAGRGEESEGHF